MLLLMPTGGNQEKRMKKTEAGESWRWVGGWIETIKIKLKSMNRQLEWEKLWLKFISDELIEMLRSI